MAIQLKSKTSIGSLFTAFSILASFIGVSINWYEDRQLDYAVQSAQVRDMSITAYSNIIYWQDLNNHFFDKAEELIEDVAITFRSTKDHVYARDEYWKGIIKLKNGVNYEIMQRELKTYHLKLLSYSLDSDSTFIKTVVILDKLLEMNQKDYLEESQRVILSQDTNDADQTAVMGNRLRAINRKYREKDAELFKKQLAKLDVYLQIIIKTPDTELFY